MVKQHSTKALIFVILTCLATLGLLSGTTFASTSKQKYLAADTCYKKLRHSNKRIKYHHEWEKCINKYLSIYKAHPTSSWAAAGMYKAAELYLKLFKISQEINDQAEAVDLLKRIIKKYPRSAYKKRSEKLLKKMSIRPPEPEPEDVKVAKTIEIKKSRKQQTKKSNTRPPIQKPVETVIHPLPEGDTLVTDLRFWSNPEYTRIVINADDERKYQHRLLKKDPSINVPFQRLYIDIEKSRLSNNVPEHTPINDDLLKQTRAGQYSSHTVRVVVDIKSFDNYKIFSLKDPFRIVIDVWGTSANGDKKETKAVTVAKKTTPDVTPTERITTDNIKSSDIAKQLALGVKTIVIDPGHGGKDPGAPGYYKGVWEKNLVLELSQKLAVILRDRLKCTVILTRAKDHYLTLEERTAIANTKKADLFISLHCNAAKNKKLTGVETYFLNLATDDRAIAVAAKENATSKKNISDLETILNDLMKNAKIKESSRLAEDVHDSIISGMRKKYSKIHNLGVKQAPFYVLLGARMPSILIETSFISNATECKRILSASYQKNLCNAITDGIEKYINATNPKML